MTPSRSTTSMNNKKEELMKKGHVNENSTLFYHVRHLQMHKI